MLQPGQDHRLHDAIDVLLRELGKDCGSGPGLTDESFQVGNPFFREALCGNWDQNPLSHCFTCIHLPPSLVTCLLPATATVGWSSPQNGRHFLRVVDRMPLQPMLITHLAHIPESITGDALSQTAGFPSDTRAKPNGPAQKAEHQRSPNRAAVVSWVTTQQANARSNRGRLQSISNFFTKKWSKRSSFEECFFTATCSLQRRMQNLSPVFKLGLRPGVWFHRSCLTFFADQGYVFK